MNLSVTLLKPCTDSLVGSTPIQLHCAIGVLSSNPNSMAFLNPNTYLSPTLLPVSSIIVMAKKKLTLNAFTQLRAPFTF